MASQLSGKTLLVRVTYTKSGEHKNPKVRENLRSLGFKKLNQTVVHKNTKLVRGRLNVVKHHVRIEPVIYRAENAEEIPDWLLRTPEEIKRDEEEKKLFLYKRLYYQKSKIKWNRANPFREENNQEDHHTNDSLRIEN